MFFAFLRDNVWRPIDARWIRRAEAACSTAATLPSGRFNFGEDLVGSSSRASASVAIPA